MKNLICIQLVVTVICLAGCQTMSKTKTSNPTRSSGSEMNPISKFTGGGVQKGRADTLTAMWKDASYVEAGKQPARGFAGRIYFFDKEKNPIAVEGDLVIYAFNDETTGGDQKPEKRFVFEREKLKSHMSVSSAGPSYSVWIPWGPLTGERKKISLVTMLRGEDNSVCQGEPIAALLPGSIPKAELEKKEFLQEMREEIAAKTNVNKVGFEESLPEGSKKVRSHEIRIPNGGNSMFNHVPQSSYMLPAPNVNIRTIEPVTELSQKPSADSSPVQPQAQNGRFARQGQLAPGMKPPRLGARSSAEGRR